jgi:hypothetical protein
MTNLGYQTKPTKDAVTVDAQKKDVRRSTADKLYKILKIVASGGASLFRAS